MRKTIIIAPGILPIPATRGGAVETGIEQLIYENEKNDENVFEIYSCFDKKASKQAKNFKKSNFLFYKFGKIDKIKMYLLKGINKICNILNINKNFNVYPGFLKFICQNIKNSEGETVLIKNSIRFVEPISKITDKPIVLQLHNDFLNKDVPDCEEIVSKCYKIVANSQYIKKRICTIENVKPSNVYVNMNCLDQNSFIVPNEKQKNEIIKKYNIDVNKKNIIFVGRISKVKGIKELLYALKLIEKNKTWNLLIVGGKWFSDNYKDKYYKELSKISKSFKDRINFLGYVKHEDIKNIYSIASIAVVPSIWEEPAGRVVLEAEAMGVPVIVSNSGGIPEYINDKSAIVVNRDELFIENLSKSINELINDTKKSLTIGNEGRKFAQSFTSERYYNEIMKIIRGE